MQAQRQRTVNLWQGFTADISQLHRGPCDRQNGQAQEQQVRAKSPACHTQPRSIRALAEGHVKNVRHGDGPGEKDQQQSMGCVAAQWAVHHLYGTGVRLQPKLQGRGSVEHPIERI